MKRLFAVICTLAALALTAEDANRWEFFQRNPQLQGWFPFGIYAGGNTRIMAPAASHRERSEWMVDLQALQGCNVIWGQHPTIYNIARDADDNPVGLNEFGQWFYGESLPEREMRIWPSLVHWLRYSKEVWGDLRRIEPLPTEAELEAAGARLAPVLDFARQLRQDHPETIVGYIIDDEPHLLAATVAAQRLLEERAVSPSMTCKPSWGGFQSFAEHMQPITGDFYVTGDVANNSWQIAERMTWLREKHPERVFYFLPLASAYKGGHEQTLPGLKDSRPSAEDMRMQFWMSLAGGCKGYYYYHLVYNTWWARGEDNLLNLVLQPNNELWPELGRLAEVATNIGPCLLPCRSLDPAPITIDCGRVRFIEFQGPAIGVGLLQDIPRPGRYFVVPWSNDVRGRQQGTVNLPRDLLAGRQLYDLHALEEVPLNDGAFTVSLEPGGGHVYLLGTAGDFAACSEIVRRARVRLPRVTARIRRRVIARQEGADLTRIDALTAAGKAAEDGGNWEAAIENYRGAVDAIAEQEKKARLLLQTRHQLDLLAGVLSETDDLLRCHFDVLGIDDGVHYLPANHYQNKWVGPEMREFVVLVGQYLESRIAERKGDLGHFLLLDRGLVLVEQARANHERIASAIEQALAAARQPVRVAYFSPDRFIVENNMNYAWLYEHFRAGWFVPDDQGVWRDRQGQPWDPANWDVVWAHQLLFAEPDGARLLPALAAQKETLAAFARNGGGLLLTGVAGQLAMDLGVETVAPDRVRECSTYPQSLTVGLAPAPGQAKHPALASIDQSIYTNANFPGQQYFAEFAWEEKQPAGQVVAVEYDQLFGPIGVYAAVVEYAFGPGKVIVAGGRACDFTPGNPFGLKDMRPGDLRRNLRGVVRDTLVYLAADDHFVPDAAAVAAGARRERPQALPLAGWKFRLDPENVGEQEQWMAPGDPPGEWDSIMIGSNWESQGYDHNGYAWYRRTITVGNRPGKRTMLHFGAVDEQATVWIDGKLVGHNRGEPEGWEAWDQPFAMDITEVVGDEPAEHLLAVRVFDISAAGGIWKPVWIEYEDR